MAPFNTTMSDEENNILENEDFLKMLVDKSDNNCQLEIKEEVFVFGKKARGADIAYEREHNRNIDNGVYKDNVDQNDLAVMLGRHEE